MNYQLSRFLGYLNILIDDKIELCAGRAHFVGAPPMPRLCVNSF